ncbi:MAG: alpha-amylase [Burkholderiales bacterium]|nr:alpha-amylase [Burkholderiales bacterium]
MNPRQLPALTPVLACLALAACGGGGPGVPPPTDTVLPTVDTSAVAAADPGSTLASDWQHGAVMEIYVRGYQDSDGNGMGDLKGLISRLDYLQDLGVKGLWLMPVNASQDHDHGYAVTDYRAIEPQYGTLADLDELLKQAHARGMGVMLDYVMNHSAGQHPAFVNSRDSTSNAFRDWYVWQNPAPTGWSVFGGNPWRSTPTGAYYAPFWDQMPDFKLTNPAVVSWHHDNLRFWLNRGVDGFRFDAVGNLVENGPGAWQNQPENYTLMQGVRSLLDTYAQRSLVCEAPDAPQLFGASTACGGAFAFGLQYDLVAAAKGNTGALAKVAAYHQTAPAGMASFLSNHDSFAGQRLWDQVGGNQAQYKLAAAMNLLLPGRPFIYYGEEIGMGGNPSLSGDWALRTPMSWTADQSGFTSGTPWRALASNVATQNVAASADPASIRAFYKSLLWLRNLRPSIAQGSHVAPQVQGGVIAWQRLLGTERSLVVMNTGASDVTASIAQLPALANLNRLYPADNAAASADAGGLLSLNLPAQSVRVYNVQP